MIEIFWRYLWLILPAGMANMTPPIAAVWWPKWNWPLDNYLKFKNKRILGDHKTIRGLVAGTLIGSITFVIQKYWLHNYCQNVEIINYNNLPFYSGFLMSFGALGGDAIKSFFKRQMEIPSGKPWFPWDQIDWVIGMIISLMIVMKITVFDMGILLIIGLGLHMLTKVIGFWIKVNKTMF